MSDINETKRSTLPPWIAPVALVVLAALVMGLPTLRGGFVGGDDHRLALDHVLVNHPSWSHALKLLTIVHGDLYQPLPLLSFSAEFALADALGLFEGGGDAGAWLFHLTNTVLHAVNTGLVWALIAMLAAFTRRRDGLSDKDDTAQVVTIDEAAESRAVATVAALLFAVHPLQTEVIAWTNGRMMLMSTLFALASLLSLASWLQHSRPRSAVLTVIFVLLSAASKVRIGLPVLLLVIVFARRARLSNRLVALWLLCAVMTGVFVLVNVWSTAGADLFSQGAEFLKGPRAVRVVLALVCYFQHLVWPVGLASYYPTPPVVTWSDLATWQTALIAVSSIVVLGWACLRSRVARLGVLWFFATLASTLPFIPARNILAADRYMYLPIIGLFWLIATLGYDAYRRWTVAWPAVARRVLPVLFAAAVVLPMIGTGWHIASFYETPISKTTRIATLFPNTPRVWERRGWSHYGEGQYAEAIECAQKELRHDSVKVQSGAYQLLGMSELRLGNSERALEVLHKAIEVDPKNPLGMFRLALAYDELGRTAEAVPYFEAAVEAAPSHNPTINRLASAYRRVGRKGDARAMYLEALANNPFEVPATMGLVELDILQGMDESYRSAERRLTTLLDWMPENTDAWTNLGVVYRALGRTNEAVEAYTRALKRNPSHVTAALNLAQIHHSAGQNKRAWPLFERVVAAGLESIEQATAVHDFLISQGAADRSVALWEKFVERFPDSADAHASLAWSYALADDFVRARAKTEALPGGKSASALTLAILAYVDLAEGRYKAAAARTESLCGQGETGAKTRHELQRALEYYDRRQPDVAWTFCLTTQLLIADGNIEGANIFIGLCEERCNDPACREQVRGLRTQTAKP